MSPPVDDSSLFLDAYLSIIFGLLMMKNRMFRFLFSSIRLLFRFLFNSHFFLRLYSVYE